MHGPKWLVGLVGLAAGAPGLVWLVCHRGSRAVQVWRIAEGQRRRAGPLRVRVAGRGEPVFVLLHGLVGSGDAFGAGYDGLAVAGTVVVPDLLGFGGSMAPDRRDFGLTAHLEALDLMVGELGLEERRLVVGGHSMGGVLALQWAARRAGQVARVVAFGAPLYDTVEQAHGHVRGLGLLEGLFALNTPVARLTCAWMCAHRRSAAVLAPLLQPEMPVPLVRQGVLHTWDAYLGGMNSLVLTGDWREAVRRLDAAGTCVVLASGARDPVPAAAVYDRIVALYGNVVAAVHPAAGHELPIAYPEWCVSLLAGGSFRGPDGS